MEFEQRRVLLTNLIKTGVIGVAVFFTVKQNSIFHILYFLLIAVFVFDQ